MTFFGFKLAAMNHYLYFLNHELKRSLIPSIALIFGAIVSTISGIGIMTMIENFDLQTTLKAINYQSLVFILSALIIARLWYGVLLATNKTRLFKKYTDRPQWRLTTELILLLLPYTLAVFSVFSLWVLLDKPSFISTRIPVTVYAGLYFAGGFAIVVRSRKYV